jgi:hypothetical protein
MRTPNYIMNGSAGVGNKICAGQPKIEVQGHEGFLCFALGPIGR